MVAEQTRNRLKSLQEDLEKFQAFTIDQWNLDLNVGLMGSFLCTKVFGSTMSKDGLGGVILNISSDLSVISPNQNIYKERDKRDEDQPVKPVSYSVAKHGIIGLTRYTSTYWANKNLRCNAICPGGIYNNQPDDFVESLSKLIPMGRMAEKDEYHGLIIFLLSDASSYINGSIISADGGRTAW